MAASICDRKNQLLGVEVIKELVRRRRDVRLYLCGLVLEEAYFKKLKRAIKEAGLENRVVLAGLVPAAEIYQSADIVLLPSKYEALPLAFLEALASGIPVVASAIAAHREIAELVGIAKEFLVARLTPEAFADAIENMEPSLALNYSTRVRDLFSRERFARELNAVFGAIEDEVRVGRSAKISARSSRH
jgi:glycosyltransferase involved in cell wall biosynthesis